ncbi:hypothetical protein [Actinophytocola algeriensis]|uniref:Uncharacterized protein n=1 Tax=Actinophytocola algeriensis TaxID=1768010 RepID=A0A7W7QEE3_9PSEU|nr:hypothetical protein [Actinophytocola algeriensis]MBB4912095.1 hypothetical protein [Actinophytocola algeriensis]MBE1477413.1 hypothetical protein [Actinophytocola algeriensis]
MRPTDSTPAHARYDGVSAFRPADTGPPSAWPTSEVLTRRPGWPADPEVPKARTATDAPAWPAPRHRAELGLARVPRGPLSPRPAQSPPSFLREPIVGRNVPAPPPRHAEPDMADTVPIGRGARHSMGEPPDAESGAVAYALPEAPVTGLRKFDLGTVPASVTPPRSWRKAAWFAVSTSAAVALGLTVATTELMSRPVNDGALIDALPAYPTGPLTLAELPHEATTSDAQTTATPSRPSDRPGPGDATTPASQDSPPRDTVIGSTTGEESVVPTEPPSEGATTPPPTTPSEPTRRTVGLAAVTPTDPAKMGDRTQEYFELVTTDPAAAHAMTTGSMAREGADGIAARYDGVERIEVQEITIDRNEAITTSKVKVVHKDGTETVEHRQLTFTWGGDPKITGETTTE